MKILDSRFRGNERWRDPSPMTHAPIHFPTIINLASDTTSGGIA